ncbi:MAG: site-2 protease family protein [Patescibacteria group bacterium]|nr:site-2 protease family protein [Patescibacteria group bacterium]
MIELLFSNPLSYLMMAVSVVIAFTVHEYCHAQTADLLGDKTSRSMGRLTVNPLAHLDPVGTVMLFLFGFGWGKPVPFNPYNLKNRRWGSALVGLSGPLSNFAMALTVGLILRAGLVQGRGLTEFFLMFVWLNVLLGVFNLIPLPPLDGSHILGAIIPEAGEWFYKMSFSGVALFFALAAIYFMMQVGSPFIAQPLFRWLAGL